MTLPAQILNELKKALAEDFRWKRTSGEWLQGGKCPQCGKPEVYTHAESPRVLKCSRLDKCGWEQHVKERYPEIFDDWSKRFKATPENPTAAADAFLAHARGLDLRGLRGAYEQEYYRDPDLDIGSATVRFALPGGSWWQRLIDQPGRFGKKKATFAPKASWRGQWWQHPGDDMAALAAADEIWIAEGIFDALSLRQHGLKAVSAMTCNVYPEESLAELRRAIAGGPNPAHQPTLVWAFDVGAAGTEYTRRFVKKSREQGWKATAAQVRLDDELGAKLDWNDLHLRDRLKPEDLASYRWHGEVLIAGSPAEKAGLLHARGNSSNFPFTFATRTYWASVDVGAIQEAVETWKQNRTKKLEEHDPTEEARVRSEATVAALRTEEIANCVFRALYFQRDEATDESLYFFRVDFPTDRPSVKGGFSGNATAASGEFKKRLVSVAPGAIWTGEQYQLDRLMQRQLPHCRVVETISFTGYSRDHGTWVFGDLAVKDGRVYEPNADGIFDLGKIALKLRSEERILDINYDPEKVDTDWLEDIYTAYGPKGLVILSYWLLTFFAEQCRRARKSLPFFELVGPPDSGKTTLLEFLWKLAGRDNYEGLDPAKATAAALARNFGKVANLPVVLIEGDRREDVSHARKFDWDELKTAYNGRSPRARAVANGGMETFEPPFRGAIFIEQNDPVVASRPILERILHLQVDKSGWSRTTKISAERLEGWPIENVSGFIVHAVRRERDVLQLLETSFRRYDDELLANPQIRTGRIAKTHAQLLAAVDALALLLPRLGDRRRDEAAAMVRQMAVERQMAISSDHPIVEQFWERVDYILANESDNPRYSIDHSRNDKLLAISLPQYLQIAAERWRDSPPDAELKKQLKTSKRRRFVEVKNVNSRTAGEKQQKIVCCWVFDKSGAPAASDAR